jgi:hypothetical protein
MEDAITKFARRTLKGLATLLPLDALKVASAPGNRWSK